MALRMTVSAMSDVGRARDNNEDAFVVADLAAGVRVDAAGIDRTIEVRAGGCLLSLSDGMGGHQAGEVASALVVDCVERALARDADADSAVADRIARAVQHAHQSVRAAANLNARRGMGATLTAVLVRGDGAYIAEVGDSRAYLLRDGRLRQITRDQSLVQLLVDHGVLTPAEARHNQSKNVILQAVGMAGEPRVAIARLALRRADRVLLCSDGVSNAVAHDELQRTLTACEPRCACETLIALANERGGDDNATAIVADVDGDDLAPVEDFETVTSTYEVLTPFQATLHGRPVTREIAEKLAATVLSPNSPPKRS
jgi:serine/threonine protein phosphatase PrpC